MMKKRTFFPTFKILPDEELPLPGHDERQERLLAEQLRAEGHTQALVNGQEDNAGAREGASCPGIS